MMRRILAVVFFHLLLYGGGLITAHEAQACDPGSFYDPAHAICQNTPPAAPGYRQPPSNAPYAPSRDYPGYGGYR
jgi:hypothetical protein